LSTIAFESVRKILIPIDGSDYSMRAAEFGLSVAKLLKAEVTVVYVIDTVVLDQIPKATERAETERELKGDGERYLKYVHSMAEKAGVKSSELLAKGRPFEQIIHLAKGLHTDLIVMGTFGLRGAERILIGSVAERVIEYSTCPVLVVK
jgi:nucleotide-binding universal stress UspA family protein